MIDTGYFDRWYFDSDPYQNISSRSRQARAEVQALSGKHPLHLWCKGGIFSFLILFHNFQGECLPAKEEEGTAEAKKVN